MVSRTNLLTVSSNLQMLPARVLFQSISLSAVIAILALECQRRDVAGLRLYSSRPLLPLLTAAFEKGRCSSLSYVSSTLLNWAAWFQLSVLPPERLFLLPLALLFTKL
jgi:hypothetical protein